MSKPWPSNSGRPYPPIPAVGQLLKHREAGNQRADFAFVRSVLLGAAPRHLVSRRGGYLRAAATVAGVSLAAMGNATGRVSLLLGRTPPAQAGIEQPLPGAVAIAAQT
jgi:hypothetical protein